jgi:hypothetical protein
MRFLKNVFYFAHESILLHAKGEIPDLGNSTNKSQYEAEMYNNYIDMKILGDELSLKF